MPGARVRHPQRAAVQDRPTGCCPRRGPPATGTRPTDGTSRHTRSGALAPLVDHLSEPALNRERVRVEVEWLVFLTDNGVVPGVRALTDDEKAALRAVVDDFGAAEIAEMAEIERETQHDVKAVEYFLK